MAALLAQSGVVPELLPLMAEPLTAALRASDVNGFPVPYMSLNLKGSIFF
jgi:hypothetical protein